MRTVLLAAAVLGVCAAAFAGDTTSAPALVGASAMRATVDAGTGQFVAPGPGPDAPPGRSVPLARPTGEDGPVAGKIVRLRGRFVSAVVARIGADGSERIDCETLDGTSTPHAGP